MTIKVLVVDDSALIRSLLSEIIKQTDDLELVGAARNAYIAKDMVMKFHPDVITLDIEMPKVDGLTFLDKLMKAKPTPVIMISTLTQQGAIATIRSLELGAIDFVAKPKLKSNAALKDYQQEIVDKIRIAAKTKPRQRVATKNVIQTIPIKRYSTKTIVGIGASIGGTEAIRKVLETLPSAFPATLITQHLPAKFTKCFAERLNALCKMNVTEATDGENILPGNAYIAPGDKHLQIIRVGLDYRIKLDDGPSVSGHKPAVDVMFNSLAEVVGKNAIAAILTGMGKDGASSLLALRKAGAVTFAQNEESCVVYGMPKAAVELGAVQHIVSLDKISKALSNAAEQENKQTNK